jgi:hypothetical protein
MRALVIAASVTLIGASGLACAQSTVLVDSTGKVAARPLTDTTMVVAVRPGLSAPSFIRPIYDAEGHVASGLATWGAGGSVLFESADCTTGAHVSSNERAGVRASAQVETPAGVVLYVGAIGDTRSVSVRSILYGSGCAPVSVRQKGVVPVDATVNLTTTYPPPLSLQ